MASENNYLSTIGISIKAGNAVIAGATDFSDIGAEAQTLDATKLSDKVAVSVPGVQSQDAWTVTYLFNNNLTTSDFRALNALVKAGAAVALEVSFPDGTKATNNGIPASNVVSGGSVNSMLKAVVSFTLQNPEGWAWTNPSTT